MICTEAAEFVSALCDGEIIPPTAAEHIGTCPACQARLRDYLNLGVELRRTASLEQRAAVPARAWVRPQNPLTAFLQKGWGTMRIPRLAFAAMIAGIVALACTLAVVKVGANSTGTIVLLNTTWTSRNALALSAIYAGVKAGSATGTEKWVRRTSLTGSGCFRETVDRVLLAIRTRTYSKGDDLSSFTQDADPATTIKEVWFEPGEQSKIDVTDVGTLTLTG